MTTLSLKNTFLTIESVMKSTEFEPSIPKYMESVLGEASILWRRINEPVFVEHWCIVNGYWDDAVIANEVEVESYLSTRNAFLLDDLADLPEPIDLIEQELFLDDYSDQIDVLPPFMADCYFDQPCEGDYTEFAHDFNLLQLEAA